MALLAGNIGLKISGRPQFLVFVIPWVRKNNGILCLKGRDYCSSVPVRGVKGSAVIVEKSQNRNRNEIFSKNNRLFDDEAKKVEKLRNQNRNEISSKNNLLFDDEAKQVEKLRNQNRNEISSKNNLLFDNEAKQVEKLQSRNRNEISSKNNVLFDDDAKQVEKLRNQNQNEISSMNNLLFDDDVKQELGLMVELGEVNEESEEMEIPRENNIHEQKVIVDGKSMEDAENSAIKLLAKRAFTAVELRKKLIGKRFLPDTVEAVLKDFQSRGLINDSLYAETYSRSRWSSSTWGPRRIKQALFNKGIQNTDAEKAVKLVFKDAESDDDQESKLGMSKLSMDHLFVQASKQWLRSQDAPKETRKIRIVRWLQYRGFNWGVTNFILKRDKVCPCAGTCWYSRKVSSFIPSYGQTCLVTADSSAL
ncbi:hypothetical protein EZV62_009306 [Acer yangbiense]|uniref:Regulatory protein RecX n=1 Tax=Acer yangbiense TaxID=1000413 RepID=A0A5C7IFY1_9ROSI|nr:hypothetical protein EZV62_009306 [Acer yangbiense]